MRDAEEDDLDEEEQGFVESPDAAFVAHHNFSPSATRPPFLSPGTDRRRGFQSSLHQVPPVRSSRWISFGQPSAYPRETFNNEQVDEKWLDQNYANYAKPWLADHANSDLEDGSGRYRDFRRQRKAWYTRSQYTILRNPFIPLVFRLIVFTFAFAAMGLGTAIYHATGEIMVCIAQNPRSLECQNLVGVGDKDFYRDPSALMAIIVDVIAVVYTIYITYDEYFSKPLGLRPAGAKVRLVLLDLVFIVFQAANLSLSFSSLTLETGACQIGNEPRTSLRLDSVCSRARALSSVLLISLVAWLATFSVSILRSVEPCRVIVLFVSNNW